MSRAVSVVVTCHNLEKYIGAAIESVLAQSYPAAAEVLVVDDFSTDSSPAVIQAYGNIRYLRTPRNLGVLMATVLGMREASADLVTFLDGDDLWHPDKLRRVVARFEADPRLGLLTHDLEYIDGNGRKLSRVSRPNQVMTAKSSSDDQMVRDGILLHGDYVWLGSAFSIRKSLIDADGFCEWAERLPDPFNTYQDWPLAFWAASRPGIRMGYLSDKLLRYRVHGMNHSGDAGSLDKALRNVRRTSNTMHAMLEIALAAGLGEPVLRATMRKLGYCAYLVDLYSGRRLAALRGFIASLGYIFVGPQKLAKEVARFAGIQVLGVRRFIALSGRAKRAAAPATEMPTREQEW